MAVEVATVGTPLQSSFCFSFMRRGKNPTPPPTAGGKPDDPSQQQQQQPSATAAVDASGAAVVDDKGGSHPYENSIKTVAIVKSVEEFWSTYNYLRRPNDLPTTTDIHFFRDGVKPTWEDPSNAHGGKWIVRLPKGLASRYWEEVILALIGGQFTGVPDGEITGAVIAIRYNEDILGVWNRTANDREIIERLRDAIKRVLQLPPHAPMEYKPHSNSIQDKSSFRNTQVWKPKSLEGRSDSRGEPRRSGSWTDRDDRKTKPHRDIERSWR